MPQLKFNVAEATLQARWKGRKSRAQANKAKQALYEAKEKALVQQIFELTKSGYSHDKVQLREMAEEIRQKLVAKINDASFVLVEYPSLGFE